MIFCEVHDSCLSLSTAILERNVFSILRGRTNTSLFQKDKTNSYSIMKYKYQVRSTRWDFEPSMVYWCFRPRMLPLSLKAKDVCCFRNNILKETKLTLFLIMKFSLLKKRRIEHQKGCELENECRTASDRFVLHFYNFSMCRNVRLSCNNRELRNQWATRKTAFF